MGVVEAQETVGHERAVLAHVPAQHFAEHGVQDVRGRVVAGDGKMAVHIDLREDALADAERSLGDGNRLHVQLAEGMRAVLHDRENAVGLDQPRVADLAAALGIERRTFEQDHALLAFAESVDFPSVPDERADPGIAFALFVTDEIRGAEFVGQRVEHVPLDDVVGDLLAGAAGALALPRHLRLESLFVDRHAALGADLAGQLQRETERVVQLKGHGAAESFSGAFERRLDLCVEQLAALADGFAEAVLLDLDDLLDGETVLPEFGVGIAHQFDHGGNHVVDERSVDADQASVTGGAADQAAQHVALAVVGRQNAVRDHEADGADVVGNDFQSQVALIVLTVSDAGDVAGFFMSGAKRSVSKSLRTPWISEARRSSPMPVSMFLRGSGLKLPSACRSYCVKTWFQISRKRSQSQPGWQSGPQENSFP